MATDKVEVDDFGLPIRKWIPPPQDDPVEGEASEEKPAVPVPKTKDEKASTPATEQDKPATPAAQAEKADSDSDDDFKDAPSTPPPGTAATTPKHPEFKTDAKPEDAKTEAPKPDTSKPDTPESDAPEPSAAKLDAPKPDAAGTSTSKSDAVSPDAAKPDTPKTDVVKDTKETTEPVKEAPAPADKPTDTEKTIPEKPTQEASAAPGLEDAANKPAAESTKAEHTRNASIVSAHIAGHSRNESTLSAGVGEFSHQQTAIKPEKKQDEDDDGGWQEMPAFAPYDMFDDDNKLVAKERTVEEEVEDEYGYGGLGGAGKGYTRVIMDDDAESATSMDDNTKYLFKGGAGTNVAEDEEEQRDAVSQMQATKDLLTEGQRIAYVGLTRLEIVNIVQETESLEKTKGAKKEVTMAGEAAKMWGQKMMIRVYAHMDISAAEQVMVEQLSEHGVVPADLTPLLMANARVKNPMAASKDDDSSAAGTPSRTPAGTPGPLSPRSPSPPRSPVPEAVAEPLPPYEANASDTAPDVKMPSDLPTTENLEIDIRWTVLCDLFLLLIADSTYDARSRLLMERVGKSLDIDWLEIRKFEKKVTDALEMQQQAEKENWNEDEHMETRRKRALKRRYVLMGLATVGGGLVIGLSAGILAPVIGSGLALGLSGIGIGGTSAFLGGAGGVAIVTTAAASSGGIVGVRAANRRTGAVKTFEYRPLHNNKRVHLIVSVSGWMTGKVDDVRLPFSTVDPIMGDLYSILWEPEMLRSTGDTINILATEALTTGLQQVLANTVLMALMSALQVPIILTKLSYLIDNPWAVSLARASQAGKILADSLIDRNLGTRPITLVGFSIGARVIFSCLQELAKRGAYGLVQNVYMFGSPVVVKKDEYLRARTVVPGRFVNGYNKNDWILGYLFRLTSGGIQRVAGLAPIEGLDWLENKDFSDLVKGHMEYRTMMPRLLRECGWLVESDEFTEIEDPDPEDHSGRQRELISEIEAARRELEKEGEKKKKKSSRFSIFGRKKQIEKAEWEIYDTSKAAPAAAATTQSSRTEDEEGRNHGVLFDIEAIRAELAKAGREGHGTGDLNDDELQVRELKSTMPPMKLDLGSPPLGPPSSTGNPRDTLRESWSADAVRRVSSDPPASGPSTSRSRGASPYYTEPDPYQADDISMTFDTSFDDSPRRAAVSSPPPPPPPKYEASMAPERPSMHSSQTVPNMTLRDPWNDPDDDDFGKEKEMTMTFA